MILSVTSHRSPVTSRRGFTPLETIESSASNKMSLSAFTLVEVMFVMAIFSIMFAVAFDVLLSGRRNFDTASIRYDLQTNAALGFNNMMRELKNSASSQIVINGTGDSIAFRVPTGYDTSGDIIWGADGTANYQIRYMVTGNQLVRNILDSGGVVVGTARILANHAEIVSFTNQTNGLIVNITTSEQNKVTKEWLSESLSLTITFRN